MPLSSPPPTSSLALPAAPSSATTPSALGYEPMADHFKSQGFTFDKKHTVLEAFGKHAVDGLLYNSYSSSVKTAVDITISCPTNPTYVTPTQPPPPTPTYVTGQAEKAKHLKYKTIAANVDVNFSVIAFTTYGGWGPARSYRRRPTSPAWQGCRVRYQSD
eukprot:scaffold7976_cov105-Isochrysis_galbana.AAC.7